MIKLNADTDNSPDRTGGAWPTQQQELLLRAALMPPDQAASAWQAWCREVDLYEDEIDLGTFRLLPLVFHNLHAAIPDDPQMARLRGIHHRNWVQTQMHLKACTDTLSDLHAAGIDTLLLKGVPLALEYYPSRATRPMGDFDVLVPRAQIRMALDLLSQGGWRAVDRPITALTDEYLVIRHAVNLADRAGRQLDLHWRIFIEPMDDATLDQLWAESVPLTVGHVDTRTLNATDHLLHACVHGIGWAPVPPVRWVADAVMILRQAGATIDWSRLVATAGRCHVTLSVATALPYLRRFDVDIPDTVLEELERSPVSEVERRHFAAQTQRSLLFGMLPVHRARFNLLAASGALPTQSNNWSGFTNYISTYYNCTGPGELALWFSERASRRVRLKMSHLFGA